MTPTLMHECRIKLQHRGKITDRRLHASANVDHKATATLPSAQQRIDGIVDIDEITRLSTIAVNHQRLASNVRCNERRHNAIAGALAWSVHRGHRQHRELDRVLVPIDQHQIGDRTGQHTSHAGRLEGSAFFYRQLARWHLAIEIASRQRDDHLGDTMHPSSLEYRQDSGHCTTVGLVLGVRGGEHGEVIDDLGSAHADQGGELCGAHIERMNLQRAACVASVGKVAQRTRRKVIDDIGGNALGEQTIDKVRPEKSCAANDHCIHGCHDAKPAGAPLCTRCRNPLVGVMGSVGNLDACANDAIRDHGSGPDMTHHNAVTHVGAGPN